MLTVSSLSLSFLRLAEAQDAMRDADAGSSSSREGAHCTMMHVSLWAHGHSNSRSRLLLACTSMPWLIYA